MKGAKVGGVLTSGLLALAFALALLQAAVLVQTPPPEPVTASSPAGPTNRFSAPGGRSGVPWGPPPPAKAAPTEREGRTPDQKQPREQHRAPLRGPSVVPQTGPRPPRRALA